MKADTFILLFLSIFIFISISSPAFSYKRYNRVTKFDPYFRKYAKRYFGPNFDWRYFKSQAIAESNLNINAKSYVGAKGIMQIMPKTFEEIQYKNPTIKGGVEQPKWNISAGIFYNRSLWKLWKAERPFKDRLSFMFGSYNAGKGNILKAQRLSKKKGDNPNIWESIVKSLPGVTGKHSKETIGYVDKIMHVKGVLK